MSSYDERKVLRLPITDEMLEGKDCWDFFEEIEDKFPDLCYRYKENQKGFELGITNHRNYLDYVLWRGSDMGEYGFARKLTEKELIQAKEIYDKLGIPYNPTDIHFVHYCYYNCSEPDDYYDIDNNEEDIFNL